MNLLGSLASVSGLTLFSRVLGVLRDIAIASTFRTGTVTDAFFIAFKLPNLLRRFFAEGAFTQAFVPVLNEMRTTHGDSEAKRLADETAGVLAVALLAITATGVVAAPLVIAVVVPGFAEVPGKQELASSLLRIMMPYILFMSLAALCSAILSSHSRFKIPAFTPALLNLSMIAATLLVAPRLDEPIRALAWGVFVGGALQLGVQLWATRSIRMLPRPRRPTGGTPVGRMLGLAGQGAVGVSVAQVSLAINMVFASFLAEGSVTWLYYADRLMELPAGMLGAALAVIILPALSRARARSDPRRFAEVIDWAMRLAVVLAVPAAVGLAALAVPVISTLFEHGEFAAEDTSSTASALRAYSAGVVGFIFVKVLASGFFAHQNMSTPVRIAVATLCATQAMNALFVLALGLAHTGLALSVSLAACLNAAMLAFALRSRGIAFLNPGWGRLVLKVAVASGLLALAVTALSPGHEYWSDATALSRAGLLAALVAGGAALYFLALYAMGVRPSQFALMDMGLAQAAASGGKAPADPAD